MDREQALDTALGQIERQFGKGAVDEDERRGAGRDRRGLDGIALARHRARRWRPAARAGSARSTARSPPVRRPSSTT